MSLRTALVAGGLLLLGVASADRAHAGSAPLPAPPTPPSATAVVQTTGSACCGRVRKACLAPCRRFELSLPVWVPGATGSLATATKDASSGADRNLFERFAPVDQALTSLTFAFVGRAELASRGWWGLADLYLVSVGSEIDWTVGTGTTSASAEALIGRAVVGHEVARIPTGGGCGACLTLTPYVGARAYRVELGIEDESATRDWIDALAGLEARWWLSPRWNLRLLADVGTAVGTGWDVSWMATFEAHWRLGRRVSVFAGYSVLDLKHEHEGGSRFVVDLTLAGPQVGLTVHL